MQVLLTGGTGFVGINIAEVLAGDGHQVVVYSKRPMIPQAAQMLSEKPGRVVWEEGDVLSEERIAEVMEKYGIDFVVHAAAITPNRDREKEQMRTVLQVNCLGTLNVLNAAAKHKVNRFVYISSVAVYGDSAQQYDPVFEDVVKNPRSTYETSKFAAERLVRRYAELHGTDAVSLRLGDVFGAWEYRTGVRDTMSAPCQAVYRALRHEKAVLSKSGATGWIYGLDTALAVKAVLEAKELRHFAYNCGGVSRWPVSDFCELLRTYIPDFTYEIDPEKEPNVSFFSVPDNGMFDMSRLEEDAGFRPVYDFERATAHYMEWALRYPELTLTEPKR